MKQIHYSFALAPPGNGDLMPISCQLIQRFCTCALVRLKRTARGLEHRAEASIDATIPVWEESDKELRYWWARAALGKIGTRCDGIESTSLEKSDMAYSDGKTEDAVLDLQAFIHCRSLWKTTGSKSSSWRTEYIQRFIWLTYQQKASSDPFGCCITLSKVGHRSVYASCEGFASFSAEVSITDCTAMA